MLTHICLCIMLMTVTYLNAVPVSSTDVELQNKKLYDAFMLEQFGIGPNHVMTNARYTNDNFDEDEILHQKRQSKTKWAKFHHGAQSPYTIAFPALIRTRRWIEQEQQ
jgi:hypothetical protein